MKKNLIILALGLVAVLPAKAQYEQSFKDAMEEAKEFDFIEPSSVWQFKDIKCK